jgi:hypothetical protein
METDAAGLFIIEGMQALRKHAYSRLEYGFLLLLNSSSGVAEESRFAYIEAFGFIFTRLSESCNWSLVLHSTVLSATDKIFFVFCVILE